MAEGKATVLSWTCQMAEPFGNPIFFVAREPRTDSASGITPPDALLSQSDRLSRFRLDRAQGRALALFASTTQPARRA